MNISYATIWACNRLPKHKQKECVHLLKLFMKGGIKCLGAAHWVGAVKRDAEGSLTLHLAYLDDSGLRLGGIGVISWQRL